MSAGNSHLSESMNIPCGAGMEEARSGRVFLLRGKAGRTRRLVASGWPWGELESGQQDVLVLSEMGPDRTPSPQSWSLVSLRELNSAQAPSHAGGVWPPQWACPEGRWGGWQTNSPAGQSTSVPWHLFVCEHKSVPLVFLVRDVLLRVELA